MPLKKSGMLDLEASANIFGSLGFHPFDTSYATGGLKPYRAWVRYSTSMLEIRLGLQKINFGSASLLRPLMWFDQIDPRDPLQLTAGVWGLLGRYYFLNNANIWLWVLYGNENLKGWENIPTQKSIPEFGGRMQAPLHKGEIALSYHHRSADGSSLPDSAWQQENIPENRFGFDVRLDAVLGLWLEASWSHFGKNIGPFTNQQLINAGMDYTFGLGNGLIVKFEQLLVTYQQQDLQFKNATTYSLFSVSCPVGLFNTASAIVYFDWKNENVYSYFNWQRQFNKISLYLMGYFNPGDYNIPTRHDSEILYAGNGVQVMVVFNH
jgi:hypothetical protein